MDDKVWTFETARFEVALILSSCDMDPRGQFSDERDVDAILNGECEWFDAEVRVTDKATGTILGRDTLGCCAYKNAAEFYEPHWKSPAEGRNTLAMKAKNTVVCHYFPGMVSQAVRDARQLAGELRNIKGVPA